MHKAPFEDRIDFYRYKSADQFLRNAREILNEIKNLDRRTTPDWKIHSLWMAFFGFYAKPFKQQRDKELKVGLRLPDDVIPSESLSVHQAIIDLRDKMFAHTDFASLKDSTGMPLNELVVTIKNNTPQFALRFIHPTLSGIEKYLLLLDALIEKVSYRGTKIWNRWAKHLTLDANTPMTVNASDKGDDVLMPRKRV